MPSFQTSRRVRHSADEMFALVADIGRYPEFVPLCQSLKILERGDEGGNEVLVARMTVAYKMLSESFTSRVVLHREAREIHVSYIDGPFTFLTNKWKFDDLEGGGSRIFFDINYEFRSKLLSVMMGSMFDKAFRKCASAFEERANSIYGMGAA